MLAGIVAVYLIITWAKNSHLFAGDQNQYRLSFQDVSGLKAGDQVRVFGYPSGSVAQIKIEQGGALVEIALNADIRLFKDASAEIRVKELMGGKMIELNPGSSGLELGPDGVIKGTASLDFSTAFSRAGEFMDQFSGEDLDSLVGDLKQIARVFARISTDLEKEGITGMIGELSDASKNLNSILGDVQSRSLVRKMDGLLVDASALSKKADGAIASITGLTDRLQDKTLPEAEKMLEQANHMLSEAEGMMTEAKDLVDQLKNRETVAGKLLYDPAFAEQLDVTLDNLNKTLDHIRTKKIFVTMTLAKKQRKFSEEVK